MNRSGTLALAGSGEYLQDMEPVDRYLMDQISEEVHVACLPTAAGTEGPERIAYWSELGVAHFSRLGVSVEAIPVINRNDAEQEELAHQISKSNFIYMSGGKPGYLYQTLKDSIVWQAILRVYHSGGVVAGCSAGAMIMGSRIPGFTGGHTGFGIIPNSVIMPHFDELPAWMMSGLRWWVDHKYILIGIDGFTALVMQGDRFQVVGTGSVTIWGDNGKQVYSQGAISENLIK